MKKRLITFCVITAIIILFVSCTNNDEHDYFGKINGTVTDIASGTAISNANVILSPGGASRQTDSNGYYEFENLEPRDYSIEVRRSGYQTDRRNITVRVGETASVNFTLTKVEE